MTAVLPIERLDLAAAADAVLMPGFAGLTVPGWLRRRVADGLGGVCLFARNVGDDQQLRALTDSLRSDRDDVVISIDEEGGGVTRLDAAAGSRFPGVAALGRVDDVDLTRQVGLAVGRLVGRAGITLNFAPCADVMLDPMNPVVGIRAFGSDPELVARHTAAFVRGHQEAGVAACAKHYPGHGDTDADTHLALAVVDADLDQMRAAALLPFAAAIEAEVAAVMAGHLLVPAVDPRPASVSGRWLTEILRQDMGFRGVVVTDALEMAALAATYGMVESSVLAIEAGADLLCLGADDATPELLDGINQALVAAVRDGRIPEARLLEAAARVRGLPRRSVTASDEDLMQDRVLAAGAARRALHLTGPIPELTSGLLVVRCEAGRNFAIGSVPWGPMAVLPPGSGAVEVVVQAGDPVPGDAVAAAGPVLVVTSDRHRYPWMQSMVDQVRLIRPDAILLEMGTSDVTEADAPAVASFGSGRVNTEAVLAALSGERPA